MQYGTCSIPRRCLCWTAHVVEICSVNIVFIYQAQRFQRQKSSAALF